MITNRLLAWIGLFSLLTTVPSTRATEVSALLSGAERIVFLGDSITHDGRYISIVESRLRQEGLDPLPELLNIGLPSEGCTGLTEPGHPFPRPNVHERLDRVLAKAQPDIVVACYGMNDGIYHPFSEERFAAYREGILALQEKVHASGATLILMTPPPFDPLPMAKKGKLAKIDAPKFAWTDIYENYDSVIEHYAQWILTLYEPVELVIDLHTPINTYLEKMRETNPDFVMSGDGVHVDATGNAAIAEPILRALGFPEGASQVDPELFKLVDQRQKILHNAWLTHTGHKRPGMKAGLPLEQAYAATDQLEKKIARLLDSRHLGSEAFENIVARIPAIENASRLFNGFNLEGWTGDPAFWSVSDETIRGANDSAVPSSTYLFTDSKHREFRLLFEVKQTVSPKHSTMHSAVAALGEQTDDAGGNRFGFRGPLLMFCHDWGIWDAHRRNRVEPANQRGTLQIEHERKGDWNLVEFLVTGNRIQCAANGSQVFDFIDKPEFLRPSPIGLQLHSNRRPQEFLFRGLVITANPSDTLVSVTENQ